MGRPGPVHIATLKSQVLREIIYIAKMMRYVFLILSALFVCGTFSEKKKCVPVKWRWPDDFKLLTSKDEHWQFYNYQCYTFRDMNLGQNGKYLCFRKKKALPPFKFRGIFDDDQGDKCYSMLEPMDLTYAPKAFCTSHAIAAQFKMNWHYLVFWGFDPKKCLRFNSILTDVWMNNYICGENIVFESEYCEEEM